MCKKMLMWRREDGALWRCVTWYAKNNAAFFFFDVKSSLNGTRAMELRHTKREEKVCYVTGISHKKAFIRGEKVTYNKQTAFFFFFSRMCLIFSRFCPYQVSHQWTICRIKEPPPPPPSPLKSWRKNPSLSKSIDRKRFWEIPIEDVI